MNRRETNEKRQIEINPLIYNHQPDKRAKMIYNQYHNGRSIIIDDLKYLWLKDPEGGYKIARSLVEAKIDKGLEIEPNNKIWYVEENTECKNKQQNYIEYECGDDTSRDIVENVLETIISIKLRIKKMSDKELKDVSENLYKGLELKQQINIIKNWDDTFIDKMVMYTYDVEKEFDFIV